MKNKCKKYRIVKWLRGKDIVYTPQEKSFFFWFDMDIPIILSLSGFGQRACLATEEEARQIIENRKVEISSQQNHELECIKAQKEFKKNEIICVE